jgi:ribosomal protein L37AE/L43A
MKNPNVIIAPWSKIEIANLEVLQQKLGAPYKCPHCNTTLIPRIDGWICMNCGYDRDWAFTNDANGITLKRREK